MSMGLDKVIAMTILKSHYGGLDYVEINLKGGQITAEDLKNFERVIAKSIVRERPIRGAELRFLRKEQGMSRSDLADYKVLQISEDEIKVLEEGGRPSSSKEILFRVFFSELLGVDLLGRLSVLLPQENTEMIKFS